MLNKNENKVISHYDNIVNKYRDKINYALMLLDCKNLHMSTLQLSNTLDELDSVFVPDMKSSKSELIKGCQDICLSLQDIVSGILGIDLLRRSRLNQVLDCLNRYSERTFMHCVEASKTNLFTEGNSNLVHDAYLLMQMNLDCGTNICKTKTILDTVELEIADLEHNLNICNTMRNKVFGVRKVLLRKTSIQEIYSTLEQIYLESRDIVENLLILTMY